MTDDAGPGPDLTSFSTLVLSLAAAALAYLGRTVMPGAEKTEANLPLARQTIDTLEMLRKKTEGNRTDDETKLLEDLLHDLRLAYLKSEPAPPEKDHPAEAQSPSS